MLEWKGVPLTPQIVLHFLEIKSVELQLISVEVVHLHVEIIALHYDNESKLNYLQSLSGNKMVQLV